MSENPGGTPRRVKVVLVVSLALNLLVLGAVVGSVWLGGERGHRANSARSADARAVGIYGHALDRADRREIGQRLRTVRQSAGRETRTELRGLALEAADVLRRTPFDKGAFSDILDRQQTVINGRSEIMRIALTEHVALMSQADRVAYANRLMEILERGESRAR